MIGKKVVTINENRYEKTYSDKGFYIERDGEKYSEAIDPLNSGREYLEIDELIESEVQT